MNAYERMRQISKVKPKQLLITDLPTSDTVGRMFNEIEPPLLKRMSAIIRTSVLARINALGCN